MSRMLRWFARRPNRVGTALVTPGLGWLVVFFGVPIVIMLAFSVMDRGVYGGVEPGLSLTQYGRAMEPLYLTVLWRTIWWSLLATGICLVLGYPVAFVIARSRRWRRLLLFLVVLPFWTSLIVRMFALVFLLRDTGFVNTALQTLGIISEPLPLLYSRFAVVLGLVYGFLPLMILPIFASLEKLDESLLEAAAMLGARPIVRFTQVVLPLSMPGVVAGCLLTFIPALGSFVTSDLLGGARHVMIGNLIQNQFTVARNWPFGSALSVFLMILVLLPMLRYLSRRDRPEQAAT